MTSKKQSIVLVGARANGQAGVVLSAIRALNEVREAQYDVLGFVDDDEKLHASTVLGLPVLGGLDAIPRHASAFFCVGDNRARAGLFEFFDYHGTRDECERLVSIIHPAAFVAKEARVGRGCYIGPNAVVMNGVLIDPGAVVNTAATIDHDSHIGFCANICPGVHTGGRVDIGDYAFVGTGAVILPDSTIGENAIVGAGAVVTRDVPQGLTVVGIPAMATDRHTDTVEREQVE